MVPADSQQESPSPCADFTYRAVYVPQQHPQAQQHQEQLQREQQQYTHHQLLSQQQRQQQQVQLQQHQQIQLQHQQAHPNQLHAQYQNPPYFQVVYQYVPVPPGQQPPGGACWAYAPASTFQPNPPAAPIVPHENDVLMGRGGKNNTHIGNEKLRKMARALGEDYIKSTKKEKSAMSRRLVKDVHHLDTPGRFLRRNRITSAWEVVDDEYAREKTSQCLRDAVTELEKGNTEGKSKDTDSTDGKHSDDSEKGDDIQEGEATSRSTTPVPSAGSKREESPVITPESSPTRRRPSKNIKVGDLPSSLSLDAAVLGTGSTDIKKVSDCRSSSPLSKAKPTTANIPRRFSEPSAMSRTEGRDESVIRAWMSMREEVMYSSPHAEPVPLEKIRRYDATGANREVCKSENGACVNQRPGLDALDLSGHSFSEANFALFDGELLKEADDANKGRQVISRDAYMSSDDPIDMEEDDGPQNDSDYAPMATEDEDLELRIDSDQTGQTEEMLVMLTDPFDTEFF